MQFAERLGHARIVPVVTLATAESALPLAEALAAGGIAAVEITLRTPAGLAAIGKLAGVRGGLLVGAGTVRSPADVAAAATAGADFLVSPGFSPAVVAAARAHGLPLLPGVASASEVMAALETGCRELKLFPAEAIGGTALLAALAGPFPEVRFCPTGGIGAGNFRAYLAQPNVFAVGGSWLTPREAIEAGDWPRIAALAKKASGG